MSVSHVYEGPRKRRSEIDTVNRMFVKGQITEGQRLAARDLQRVVRQLVGDRSRITGAVRAPDEHTLALKCWITETKARLAELDRDAWTVLWLVVIDRHPLRSPSLDGRRSSTTVRVIGAALDHILRFPPPS